nr:hypothetical protein [Bacillus cereus group sp. BfR-BA-01309]
MQHTNNKIDLIFPDTKDDIMAGTTDNTIIGKLLNYSPLNVLTDCLKWEIPKYRSLVASNSLGYPRSSYG